MDTTLTCFNGNQYKKDVWEAWKYYGVFYEHFMKDWNKRLTTFEKFERVLKRTKCIILVNGDEGEILRIKINENEKD